MERMFGRRLGSLCSVSAGCAVTPRCCPAAGSQPPLSGLTGDQIMCKLAGKLLEKDITYMPVDVRNSGWYLVAASTLCVTVCSDSGVAGTRVSCSGQTAGFICTVHHTLCTEDRRPRCTHDTASPDIPYSSIPDSLCVHLCHTGQSTRSSMFYFSRKLRIESIVLGSVSTTGLRHSALP
ncbi:hypothetical protein DV515_00008427 [Chloebia gouldiae]|uniref:Uncharacterized protein n=1 Tax=Chloebia gouldiae TaxID=44316 RepID=A0A3L8SFT3_CHLGU|nr:hypothetical protein DV515_00008427 [Chloebia gouldiae]